MASITLKDLFDDLHHYYQLASKAIADKDWDAHLIYGGQFHRTATRIEKETGQDPRASFVFINPNG